MKLIPIYSWNKTRVKFHDARVKLSNQPWFQGVLLLVCVVAAMLFANLPATKHFYHDFLETNIIIHAISPNLHVNLMFPEAMTVEKFINDILMVVFFFVVGLEIKREVAYGELSSPKKALLPVIAAFGGVVCPALIYTIVNHGTPGASGWGIPTATDIAFAVCILSVLGDRVPVSLKVFLTALAIADDLIAILVVAIFYGGSVKLLLILVALVLVAFALFLNLKLKVRGMFPYLLISFVVWVLFYYGGIHATMSGVVMAFVIPNTPRYTKEEVLQRMHAATEGFFKYDNIDSGMGFPSGPQRHYMRDMKKAADGAVNMSYMLEHKLSNWVNFLIMPIFALANAGVELSGVALGSVGLGIMLGLVLGKPVGITLFSWIAIKLGIGEKPDGATWPLFFAVACLGGIGFTMSIFVDTLSFGDQTPELMHTMQSAGKIAVLAGSICSGILGSILVSLTSRLKARR